MYWEGMVFCFFSKFVVLLDFLGVRVDEKGRDSRRYVGGWWIKKWIFFSIF